MSKIKNNSNDSQPQYPDAQLMHEQQRLINEERKLALENFRINRLENKIEQARRNIEVMIKAMDFWNNSTDTNLRKLIGDIVEINLNILKETVNIK